MCTAARRIFGLNIIFGGTNASDKAGLTTSATKSSRIWNLQPIFSPQLRALVFGVPYAAEFPEKPEKPLTFCQETVESEMSCKPLKPTQAEFVRIGGCEDLPEKPLTLALAV